MAMTGEPIMINGRMVATWQSSGGDDIQDTLVDIRSAGTYA